MSRTDLNVSVVVGLVDRLTKPIKSAIRPVDTLGKSISATKETLNKFGSTKADIQKFTQLKRGSVETSKALKAAQISAAKIGKEFKATEKPTKAMESAFANARRRVNTLREAQENERRTLQTMRDALSSAGVSTTNLSRHQRDLTQSTKTATAALKKEQSALDQIRERQARVSASREKMHSRLGKIANLNFAGEAASRVSGGIRRALGGVVGEAVGFESAMGGVRKVVEFREPDGLQKMAKTIRGMSRDIPISAVGLANIAAAGGELGIKETNLPDFVRTTAIASVAFDMTPEEAGDSMAKLSNVFQIPIDDIAGLGDAMNHLSNGMPAKAREITRSLLRVGGNARQFGLLPKQTAALTASFIALGKPPEVAGTAVNAMLAKLQTADKQSKKFQSALADMGLSASELKDAINDDAQGALIGFLENLETMDKGTRAGILSDLFGLEYADDISLLAGSLGTYRDAVAEMTDETKWLGKSMNEEFANKAQSTANKYQLMKNKISETSGALGKKLLPSINIVMGGIGRLMTATTGWIERNPKLTTGIVIAGAAVGALAAVIAPVMFGAAMLATTFTVTSYAFTLAGAQARGLGAGLLWVGKTVLPVVGKGITILGRALIANPIGAVIAGIAVGGYLIYRNWQPVMSWFGDAWDGVKNKAGRVYDWFANLTWSDAITAVQLGALITPLKWTSQLIPSIAWGALAGKLSLKSLVTPIVWTASLIPKIGWAALAGKLSLRALVTPVVWVSQLIPSIAWGALAGKLSLKSLVTPIVWTAGLIPKIGWAAFAGKLSLRALVTPVVWASQLIPSIAWGALAGKLSLKSLVTPIVWTAGLIPKIGWAALAGKLSLRTLILGALKWTARMIPLISWPLLAGELAWDLLVKPLVWDKFVTGMDKATAELEPVKRLGGRDFSGLHAEEEGIQKRLLEIREAAPKMSGDERRESRAELVDLSRKLYEVRQEISRRRAVADQGSSLSVPAITSPVTKTLDGARRLGGKVWRGGSFLVGEDGPEILHSEGNGAVIPNGASMGLIAALAAGSAAVAAEPQSAAPAAPSEQPPSITIHANGLSAAEAEALAMKVIADHHARQRSDKRRALND